MRTDAASGEMPSALLNVDVWEFCRQGKVAEGVIQAAGLLKHFERFCESQHDSGQGDADKRAPTAGRMAWRVEGRCDKNGRCSLQLSGSFISCQECMRCGKAVEQEVSYDRLLRICKSEQEADSLELDENEDAVAAPGKVNVVQWLEDEMLLCLPMFPAHDTCEAGFTAPLAAGIESTEETEGAVPDEKVHRPFEQLAGLLKDKPKK